MTKALRQTGWPWGAALVSVFVLAWTGAALWFQFPAVPWLAFVLPLAGLALMIWAASGRRRLAWLVLLGIVVIVAAWWVSVRPLQDRQWAPDVARGVVADVQGSKVHLSNVRDFRWRTRDEAEERWTQKTVDLDQLNQVDFISTIWASPHIAHTMVGFGFEDGEYVVFSAEIRREHDEKFSEIGGFFKKFELVLIAANQEDIVRLRTDVRREQVTVYPLELTPEQGRALFLSYTGLGNELAEKPRFYQTITTNCTTVIWKLARMVDRRIPMDWRVLLSGHTQDYLSDLGLISEENTRTD